ncbi:acetamidase/formamidase family protein [Thermanaeromonas sp. C210]|uniref:acetamidase/formamidase family protein n=1 Tax=Thermanaeromonas sp. C210 TaxID=2731925 RepID=UPI00155BFF99|nr:acetamidase/formamidase family protein [Thermanaeromonas sp. C210]GFN22324.1 amidase [Thermanaeromonas sp. C210]
MATIEVRPKGYNYVFSPYLEPTASVKPGDKVIVYTDDAFESRIKTKDDLPAKALATAKFLNPQTGPIYIEGAEPGDTLAVKIHSIEFTRDYAVSCFIKYFGGLTSTNLTRTLQEPLEERVWIWHLVDDGRFLYNDEIRVKVPAQPFLGTIATAPELEAISALTPGYFGGNMDVPDVRPGNTLYLPVSNPGALFYVGDCHAAQGQGELCGVALEITGKATLTFEVIKGKNSEWPRIESPEKIMTVGSARPMEDAARIAYAELVKWLAEDYGFTVAEAYQLLTQVGGLYVGNMVDTSYSLVASIEKKYLERT